MNHYLQKTSAISLERALTELMTLNIKTVQKINFLTPGLLNSQNPEQLLEEHVAAFIKNGYKSLDYIDKLFVIMENYWFNVSDSLEEYEVENTLFSVSVPEVP